MRRVDTVLFDFDGTIMDTNDLIVNSWQYTISQLSDKVVSDEEVIAAFGEKLEDTAKRFMPELDPAVSMKVYRDYHIKIFYDEISLFPGVREMLEAVQKDGYTIGLVTSRLRRSVKIGMEKYNLFPFFDAVVTLEDTELSKPSPQPMLKCLDLLGKSPEQAVMIGDAKHDIEGARAAGVIAGLVGWALGVTPEEREGEYKPDFILENPEDILKVLDELNG